MTCLPGTGGFFAENSSLRDFAFVDGGGNSDKSSITVPANVQEGDLILFANMAVKTSIVASTVPSGFTKIFPSTSSALPVNISGTTYYFHVAMGYKIAAGTEGGTSLSSMSFTSNVDPGSALAVMVFRGSKKITGVTVQDYGGTNQSSGLISRTIASASGTRPLLAVANYMNLGASWTSNSQRDFSPAPDDEQIYGVNNQAVRWKFFGESNAPSDIACSMASASQNRTCWSFYLELATE